MKKANFRAEYCDICSDVYNGNSFDSWNKHFQKCKTSDKYKQKIQETFEELVIQYPDFIEKINGNKK